MKRRDFIDVAGKYALLAAIVNGCSTKEIARNSHYLVETPEKRAEYLAKMLKALCTDLGPHPTGSPEFDKAAEIVRKEMELSLPIVEFDEFTFDRWVLLSEPELYVGNIWVEAYPRIETAGTSQNGISGILKKGDEDGIPYSLVDKLSDEIKAYITVTPMEKGKAVPIYASRDIMKKIPTVTIGKQDIPVLESALKEKTTVRLKAPSEFIPDSRTRNVVGTLPGESTDEIVFLAHLDTVYTAPGANDNTASLAAMLMLAHAVSGTKPKKTITFIATTGEEYGGYKGATHYAEKRKSEGTLQDIKFIVNFDSPTWNTDIEIWSEDEELQELIQAIDRDLNIPGTPQMVNRTGFSLDAKPFLESGARAVYAESNGPWKHVWHRPEDTPDEVRVETVEITFLLFNEFVKRVQDI